MKRHLLNILVGLVILLNNPLLGLARPFLSQISSQTSQQDLRLLRSDEQGILVSLDTPSYTFATQNREGIDYFSLEIPKMIQSAEPGRAQLPMREVLLAVPPGVQIDLRLVNDDAHSVPGQYNLLPSLQPLADQDDLQPGQYITGEVDRLDDWYPESPARIAEEGWLRQQRFVRLELFPFQYNSASGQLQWHRSLQVELIFSGSASLAAPQGDEDPVFDKIYQDTFLNQESVKKWLSGSEQSVRNTTNSYAGLPQPEAGETRYRIEVKQEGIFSLSYDALRAAGMDVDAIDPRTFHMTSQGEDVAILVEGEADGHFDTTDRVIFYGEKFTGDRLAQRYASEADWWRSFMSQDTQGQYFYWKPKFNAAMLEKYTNTNVYWLTVGGTPGPRMDSVDGTPGSATTPSSYPTTVHTEKSRIWKTTTFTGEDTWFWDEIKTTGVVARSYTTTLTLPATDTISATLRGEIVALVTNDRVTPDHRVKFYVNRSTHPVPLIDATWDGKSRYHFETNFPQSTLTAGVNSLDLVISKTVALTSEWLFFDWFEIDYRRQFQAEGDQIHFAGDQAGTWKYSIAGFPTGLAAGTMQNAAIDLLALDVTYPLTPTQVKNVALASGVVEFQVTHPAGEQYYAGIVTPVGSASIQQYTPPDLTSTPADYIIVTHHDFLTATQTLADYRANQGLSVKIVDVADLYNLYNDGIYHPIAIKNYLADVYARWQPKPTYALLVGDGHWNFLGYSTYDSPPIYMPPNLSWVDPWQGEVDSANLLAMVNGTDPLIDLIIGRLSVNNLSELNAIIQKTIAYESTPLQSWQGHYLFVADNVPDIAGDFEELSNGMISTYISPTLLTPDRLFLSSFIGSGTCGTPNPPRTCPAATTALLNDLNQTGATLVNYIGHASLNSWTSEQIFTNNDILSMTNGSQLPVFLTMTCLDGYWIHPNLSYANKAGPGLAESLVRADGRGAVATYSPTGLGVSTGHDYLHRGFYNSLFQKGDWQLGAASLSAATNLYTQAGTVYSDLLYTFTVFGDPALHIASPFGVSVNPTSLEGHSDPDSTVSYTLQITNTGLTTDTYLLSGAGNLWNTTLSFTLTSPIAPGGSVPVTVTVQIPAGAVTGNQDTYTLTVTSQGDTSRWKMAVITTTASQTSTPTPTPTLTPTPTATPTPTPTPTLTPTAPSKMYIPLIRRNSNDG